MGADSRFLLAEVNMILKIIDECRISGSSNLLPILNLGTQPLANSLKKSPMDSEDKFPLSISFCPDSSLLQLNETIDKKTLFKNYIWVTGTSKTTKRYASKLYNQLIQIAAPSRTDFILEIASNDGTFLQPFIKNYYTNVLGVDPAVNIVQKANECGIPTLSAFWNSSLAEELLVDRGAAKIILARNVVPHVSNLSSVIEGIATLLDEGGIGAIEFHDAGKIQSELHYDSIYHEHLCYFSIQSITFLLNLFNLIPFHIEPSLISGGSWVIFFSNKQKETSFALQRAVDLELQNSVNSIEKWENFARLTLKHKDHTLEMFNSIYGKKVVGFGSSARSQTYLNYCGIDNNYISAIIDNNPMKQGLFTPGSSIPIVDIKSGLGLNPEIIIILAWNFQEEIISSCLSAGYKGKFMSPLPNKLHYVEKS